MSSSAGLGDVVDEGAWWAAELVVQGDRGGECEEAACDAGSEAAECAGAVALEREDVLGGPVDRLDPLADRGEVKAAAGFVFAAWSDDQGAEVGGLGFEVAAGVALVADHGERPAAVDASQQLQTDVALAGLRRSERHRPWCAVGGHQCVCGRRPQKKRVWLAQ